MEPQLIRPRALHITGGGAGQPHPTSTSGGGRIYTYVEPTPYRQLSYVPPTPVPESQLVLIEGRAYSEKGQALGQEQSRVEKPIQKSYAPSPVGAAQQRYDIAARTYITERKERGEPYLQREIMRYRGIDSPSTYPERQVSYSNDQITVMQKPIHNKQSFIVRANQYLGEKIKKTHAQEELRKKSYNVSDNSISQRKPQFAKEVQQSLYKKMEEQPIESLFIPLAGGFAVGGASMGLSALGPSVATGVQWGGIGLGGLYAGEKANEILIQKKSPGVVFGESMPSFLSFGLGATAGSKAVGFFVEPYPAKPIISTKKAKAKYAEAMLNRELREQKKFSIVGKEYTKPYTQTMLLSSPVKGAKSGLRVITQRYDVQKDVPLFTAYRSVGSSVQISGVDFATGKSVAVLQNKKIKIVKITNPEGLGVKKIYGKNNKLLGRFLTTAESKTVLIKSELASINYPRYEFSKSGYYPKAEYGQGKVTVTLLRGSQSGYDIFGRETVKTYVHGMTNTIIPATSKTITGKRVYDLDTNTFFTQASLKDVMPLKSQIKYTSEIQLEANPIEVQLQHRSFVAKSPAVQQTKIQLLSKREFAFQYTKQLPPSLGNVKPLGKRAQVSLSRSELNLNVAKDISNTNFGAGRPLMPSGIVPQKSLVFTPLPLLSKHYLRKQPRYTKSFVLSRPMIINTFSPLPGNKIKNSYKQQINWFSRIEFKPTQITKSNINTIFKQKQNIKSKVSVDFINNPITYNYVSSPPPSWIPKTPAPPPPPTIIGPGGFLLPFGGGGKRTRPSFQTQSSFKTSYTPDVASLTLDITGKKPSKREIIAGLPRPKLKL